MKKYKEKILINLKIFILVFSFILWLNFTNADLKISLQNNSSEEINLDDEFDLSLNISYDWDFSGWEIKINWLSDFYKSSQIQTSSFRNINWVITQSQTYNFKFYPNEVWDYIIWPAYIETSSWTIKSNTIKISVVDENIVEKIKWPIQKYDFFSYIKYSFLILFFVILLIIFIYKKIKNNNKKEIKKIEETPKEEEFNLLEEIKKIEENIEDEKNIFYSKINNLIRKYIFKIYNIDIYKLSYKEVEDKYAKNINLDLLEIYKNTYYFEFNNLEDNIEKRKEILIDLKKIKNK